MTTAPSAQPPEPQRLRKAQAPSMNRRALSRPIPSLSLPPSSPPSHPTPLSQPLSLTSSTLPPTSNKHSLIHPTPQTPQLPPQAPTPPLVSQTLRVPLHPLPQHQHDLSRSPLGWLPRLKPVSRHSLRLLMLRRRRRVLMMLLRVWSRQWWMIERL